MFQGKLRDLELQEITPLVEQYAASINTAQGKLIDVLGSDFVGVIKKITESASGYTHMFIQECEDYE